MIQRVEIEVFSATGRGIGDGTVWLDMDNLPNCIGCMFANAFDGGGPRSMLPMMASVVIKAGGRRTKLDKPFLDRHVQPWLVGQIQWHANR